MITVEEIDVVLYGKNIVYYENLGYIIPRRIMKYGHCVQRNTKIKVKIKDLQKGSNIQVPLKCDCCGLLHSTKYQDYIKYNHDGLTYCNKCSNTILLSGENNAMFGKGYLRTGENNPMWNPLLTDEYRELKRYTPEYKEWVKKCMFIADYKSQISRESKPLEVHHLNDWANHIEQRYDILNGIVLTKSEHKSFHNWQKINYPKTPCTHEQFKEWNNCVVYKIDYNGEIMSTTRAVFCIEENTSYKSVEELCSKWGCAPSGVYQCCNYEYKSIYEKHVLWLDQYRKMTEEDIIEYLDNNVPHSCGGIKVICLNTNKTYNSIKEASEKSNCCMKSITDCCLHKRKFTRHRPGYPTYWMYLSEYETLSESQIFEILNFEKVFCITTGEIFKCNWEASEVYNIASGDITRCCLHKRNYCGMLEDGSKLVWIYYRDKQNIISI